MAATKKGVTQVIEIRPIELARVQLRLVGDTSLIMHQWSAKAKRQMLEAQQGVSKGKKKEFKNPLEDFINAAYFVTDENLYPGSAALAEEAKSAQTYEEFCAVCEKGVKFGFPVTAFKQAAISAAYRMGWSKDKMSLRGAFFIESDSDGLVEIKSDIPAMREDPVHIAMGASDLRYRPEFQNWYCDIVLSYNVNGPYSLENIINILNAGGYVCGVGEWRVERDGQHGMFHVAMG